MMPWCWVQGGAQQGEAPVPPYLHYHDAADEEESCPQPSALPPALAASHPSIRQHDMGAYPRFHSHPPLPPHPLLKLSCQQRPEASSKHSPQAAARSPRAAGNRASLTEQAGTGIAEDDRGPVASSPEHGEAGLEQYHHSRVKASIACKSATVHSPDPAGDSRTGKCPGSMDSSHVDRDHSRAMQLLSIVDCRHDQQQHESLSAHAAVEQQEQQRQQQSSEAVSDCDAAHEAALGVAVGDDELLEHEPDAMPQTGFLQPEPQPEPQSSDAPLPAGRGSGVTYSVQQQHPHQQQQQQYPQQQQHPQQDGRVSRHQQNQDVAEPQYGRESVHPWQNRGQISPKRDAGLTHHPHWNASQPQRHQFQHQAVGNTGAGHARALPDSGVVAEEHVFKQPSKLRAAYRSCCDDQQQRPQLQPPQQENSEPASCYEQPSMQAVPERSQPAALPTKVVLG